VRDRLPPSSAAPPKPAPRAPEEPAAAEAPVARSLAALDARTRARLARVIAEALWEERKVVRRVDGRRRLQ